ncbi:VPLPA-CTERM sorting domain-containing protein [Sedimentitalea arenosa]|nr:VPLPA-CTERM sorting domain-containing protein [Arenibacterium arenosum]
MRKMIFGSLSGLALMLSVGSAAATTIYNEAVDGDLDAIGTTNVNLVAGVNTILGSINQTPPAETDRIRFTQAIGMTVDSIILSFAAPFDDASIGQNMNSALFNSVANLFDDSFGAINSGASISASFFDSFGPETGPLSQDTGGAVWDFQLSAGLVFPAQPWTLTINTTQAPVDVIPLPAGGVLLLTGIAGFAALKRRKRRPA